MSMYQKNTKVDEEREFFAGLFLILSFVCMCATPVLWLVGLIAVGIITGMVATVSGVIGWLIAPEEYKTSNPLQKGELMVEPESPNPTRNEHTETVSNTKLTMKERINSYLRPYSPYIQFLWCMFVVGVVGALLGRLPIPLFKLFDILFILLVPPSILGFVLLAFWGFASRNIRKRNTYKR